MLIVKSGKKLSENLNTAGVNMTNDWTLTDHLLHILG